MVGQTKEVQHQLINDIVKAQLAQRAVDDYSLRSRIKREKFLNIEGTGFTYFRFIATNIPGAPLFGWKKSVKIVSCLPTRHFFQLRRRNNSDEAKVAK